MQQLSADDIYENDRNSVFISQKLTDPGLAGADTSGDPNEIRFSSGWMHVRLYLREILFTLRCWLPGLVPFPQPG